MLARGDFFGGLGGGFEDWNMKKKKKEKKQGKERKKEKKQEKDCEEKEMRRKE